VSARIRITLWCALLLTVTLASSVIVTRIVLFRHLAGEVDTELVHETAEVDQLRHHGVDPATGRPFVEAGPLLDAAVASATPRRSEELLAIVAGHVMSHTPQHPIVPLEADPRLVARWSSAASPTFGTVGTSGGTVRYLVTPVSLGPDPGRRGTVFVAAKFVDHERHDVSDTVRTAWFVGVGVLLVAILLAWLVAGRMLAPVRDLEVLARSITDTDLSRRLEVQGDDEIGRLARAFNAMLDRVESAFRSQAAFIDDAGHELRTPITVIRGNLELLGDDAAERADARAVMLDELDRMARMVNDLLLLARADHPDFLRPEEFESSALGAEVLAKVQALADRTWIDGGRAAGPVTGDRHRLTQAWMQLAQNAVQHTATGDPIELGSRVRGGMFELWVGDSGPGVPPGEREVIFERFARGVDGERDPQHFGLGLPIVRAIAEAHRGRVTVATSPLGGALFTVVVPVGGGEGP
jgi:two-component system, OmpR family, sensor kinase